MDIKDIVLILIALFGWLWGVIQFFINRKNQNKDKLIDRKYESYVGYMRKYEEIVNNYRKNPTSDIVYGMPTNLLQKMLTGNEEDINRALLDFNSKLSDVVKTSSEPLFIIKQELNALRLVCSTELLIMIKELDLLIIDFNEQTTLALKAISSMDMNNINQMNIDFTQNEKWSKFEKINNEIIDLMRKEIGSK